MTRSSWPVPRIPRIGSRAPRGAPFLLALLAALLWPGPALFPAPVSGGAGVSLAAPGGDGQVPTLAGTLSSFAAQRPDRHRQHDGLTGRLTWGEQGAVRITLLSAPRPAQAREPTLMAEVVNEGLTDFAIHPRDRWTALLADGRRVALERLLKIEDVQVQESRIPLAPYESALVLLVPERPLAEEPAALEYRSQFAKGAAVQLRSSWTGPSPRLTVAPVYPTTAGLPSSEALREAGILAHVVVGPDGQVEGVFMDRSLQGALVDRMRESVLKAVLQWRFEPGRENGQARRTVYERQFLFDTGRVARATLPVPVEGLEIRLGTLLTASFDRVIPLPGAKGFVIAGKPGGDGKVRGAKGVLIRYGEDPGGGGSWVAATAATWFTRGKEAPCGCGWWEPQDDAGAKTVAWIASNLEVPPSPIVLLAPLDPGAIPSGYPEPPAAGAWSRGALRGLLRLSLAGDTAAAPPAESDFLAAAGPATVTGSIRPPELIRKSAPDYPEMARRAKLQGKVVLEAVIDTDGNVEELRVLRSIPMLDKPAADAVCCWKYRPATLDGRPVAVYFTVLVEFSLH